MKDEDEDLQTAAGSLRTVRLTDPHVQRQILLSDKLQVTEGLVVEHFFDRITGRRRARPRDDTVEAQVGHGDEVPPFTTLAADTFIANPCRRGEPWIAFVLTALTDEDALLQEYLAALDRVFRVLLVRWHPPEQAFTAQDVVKGRITGEERPLLHWLKRLSPYTRPRRYTAPEKDAAQDERHQHAVTVLMREYRDEIIAVLVPRILANAGIQAWFGQVWNVDRIVRHGGQLFAFEVKHKYPAFSSASRRLIYGMNDGQIAVLRRLNLCRLTCVHLILANPFWNARKGCGYLSREKRARAFTGVEAKVLTRRRLRDLAAGASREAPQYTAYAGEKPLHFRELRCEEFRDLGVLKEGADALRAGLRELLDEIPEDEPQPETPAESHDAKKLPRLTEALILERRLQYRNGPVRAYGSQSNEHGLSEDCSGQQA